MGDMTSGSFSTSSDIDAGGALLCLILAFFVGRHYHNRSYPPNRRYRTTVPRFWAGVVDQAVLFPSTFLLDLAAAWLSPYLLALMHILINTAYSILMHARYGQTIGKCVCKIKIIDHLTGTRINLNQSALRDSGLLSGLLYAVAALKGEDIRPDELTLTGAASMVAGTWFVLEIITMLLNKKRRALHDLIAGTVVVRTSIDENHPAVLAPSPPEESP